MSIKYKQKEHGFTLIEAVIAATIFAFVIVAVLGVYDSTLRLDNRTRAIRSVADNSRFIMALLDKEITNGHIDYDSYLGGASASNCTPQINHDLYLINQAGEEEHICLKNGNLVLSKDGIDSNLNSAVLTITNLKFLIYPTSDPYTSAARTAGVASNAHSRVTVIMEVKSNSVRDPFFIDLQSTFSPLYYPSRQ
jgi:type II secretory pathway pseudopilin PulG